jgi:DNA-binding response OmpR family regulator
VLDDAEHSLTVNGKRAIFLSRCDWRLLRLFFSAPNQTLTFSQICQCIGCVDSLNRAQVAVSRLRARIHVHPPIIATIRGEGYRLDAYALDTVDGDPLRSEG